MKTIITAIIISSFANAGVWSLTKMEIATSKLPPFISSQMNNITNQVVQINAKYAQQLKQQSQTKEDLTNDIRILEGEILLELKRLNHHQINLNKAEAQ